MDKLKYKVIRLELVSLSLFLCANQFLSYPNPFFLFSSSFFFNSNTLKSVQSSLLNLEIAAFRVSTSAILSARLMLFHRKLCERVCLSVYLPGCLRNSGKLAVPQTLPMQMALHNHRCQIHNREFPLAPLITFLHAFNVALSNDMHS